MLARAVYEINQLAATERKGNGRANKPSEVLSSGPEVAELSTAEAMVSG